jgi:predicted adenylyl cyclase CyaB
VEASFLPSHRCLELKTRNPDPERALNACGALAAEVRGGPRHQQDTYFQGPRHRLKLREEKGGAHLIFYERADLAGERAGRHQFIGINKPDEVKEALATMLGVEAVVCKTRHLFLWEGVRIHLDDVEGLGHFIELEARVTERSDLTREKAQLATLRRAFEIQAADLVAHSYCDLARAVAGARERHLGSRS